jgi:transcriptional regulator with XRE-family HTH domain
LAEIEQNLREWRKSKGWTQADIAEKINENPKTYQTYESGRTEFPAESQAKIRKLGFKGQWPGRPDPLTLEELRQQLDLKERQDQARYASLKMDLEGLAEQLRAMSVKLGLVPGLEERTPLPPK